MRKVVSSHSRITMSPCPWSQSRIDELRYDLQTLEGFLSDLDMQWFLRESDIFSSENMVIDLGGLITTSVSSGSEAAYGVVLGELELAARRVRIAARIVRLLQEPGLSKRELLELSKSGN